MDCLIVMDDVWGIADISKKFANFLTVSNKIWVSLCVCFSRYCSCYTNLTKNNFPKEYF